MCDEPQGADPRALLSAAALGSFAGLVLGGGYLLSAHLTAPSNALNVASPTLSVPASPQRAAAKPIAQAEAPDAFTLRVPLRLLPFAAEPFHPAVDAVSGRDRTCLTQAVYYEARGEAAEGQQAVAQVVLNRLRHPAFPKSVCGVVFQRSADGCQFSFACENHPAIGREEAAWRRADQVAEQALNGFVMRRVGRATNFHVSRLATQWSQGLAQIAQIGAHVFYGFAPHAAGASSARRAEPAPRLAAATPQAPTTLTLASLGSADGERVHVMLTPAKLELPESDRPAPLPAAPLPAQVAASPTAPASTGASAAQAPAQKSVTPTPTTAVKPAV